MADLDLTRPVDDTDDCDLAWWEVLFTEIETYVNATRAAVEAITNWADASALLTGLLTVDGAGSLLDADKLDGLHATDIMGDDRHYPAMAAPVASGVYTSASYTEGQGICIDMLGNVWVGCHDGATAKVLKFASRRLDTAPTVLDLGVADYKVVELVASRWGVFAVLAEETADGWSTVATTPGLIGKVAKISIATGLLDASWGTAGILDLPAGCLDPWCACADDQYLWVGCLTSPGEVAYVNMSDGTKASLTATASHNMVTAICAVQVSASAYEIHVGFHDRAGDVEGRISTISDTPSWGVNYVMVSPDHDQVVQMASGFGVVVATFDVRASGNKMVAYQGADPDPDSNTILDYEDITLKLSNPGTYATAPKTCISPSGSVYIADGGTGGSVGRFSNVLDGWASISEVIDLALGTLRANNLLHDGRHLWIVGDDSGTGKIKVAKVAV